jgi:hypothetical protein
MILYSSLTLYTGDAMMVALMIAGIISLVGLCVKHSRRFLVLDLDNESLRNFCYFQIVWLLIGLVAFKAIILQELGRNTVVTTGTGGSVQFSTGGEAVAFALILFGLYRTLRWSYLRIRATLA